MEKNPINSIESRPDPDRNPDNLRGGQSHGHITSCVKNKVNRSNSVLVTRPDRHRNGRECII